MMTMDDYHTKALALLDEVLAATAPSIPPSHREDLEVRRKMDLLGDTLKTRGISYHGSETAHINGRLTRLLHQTRDFRWQLEPSWSSLWERAYPGPSDLLLPLPDRPLREWENILMDLVSPHRHFDVEQLLGGDNLALKRDTLGLLKHLCRQEDMPPNTEGEGYRALLRHTLNFLIGVSDDPQLWRDDAIREQWLNAWLDTSVLPYGGASHERGRYSRLRAEVLKDTLRAAKEAGYSNPFADYADYTSASDDASPDYDYDYDYDDSVYVMFDKSKGWRVTTTKPPWPTPSLFFSASIFYPKKADDLFSEVPDSTTQSEVNDAGEAGVKFDDSKRDFTLLPWEALEEVVDCLEYGARKYARDNWRKVPDAVSRYEKAGIRHRIERMKGNDIDPESGHRHYAHEVCCLLFQMALSREAPTSTATPQPPLTGLTATEALEHLTQGKGITRGAWSVYTFPALRRWGARRVAMEATPKGGLKVDVHPGEPVYLNKADLAATDWMVVDEHE